MTDTQQLFDYARKQFNEIAEDVERHFESVAGQLREWIPSDTRFTRSPPPPKRLPPPTTLQAIQRWMSHHRALTIAAATFFLTGSVGLYIYHQNTLSRRKRRARRSPSGARTDVVVIAGSVANALTSALYLDLERRGYIVYVLTSTSEEEHYVRSQSRVDLLPLPVDLVDPFQAQDQLARFQGMLAREHYAFDGAPAHRLRLVGVVLAPDTSSPAARVEEISAEEWSDALNAKVLHTIATAHLLLPTLVEHRARLLLLTPSVTPSLRPPLHAVESTVYGALSGFAAAFAAEIRPEGVSVTHFKLGHVDVPAITAKQRRDGVPAPRLRATPVRRLQDAVFDALVTARPPRTWHVGRGSLAYDAIGAWAPAGFVSWMLGSAPRARRPVETFSEDLQSSRGSLTWEKLDGEA